MTKKLKSNSRIYCDKFEYFLKQIPNMEILFFKKLYFIFLYLLIDCSKLKRRGNDLSILMYAQLLVMIDRAAIIRKTSKGIKFGGSRTFSKIDDFFRMWEYIPANQNEERCDCLLILFLFTAVQWCLNKVCHQ